MGWCVGKTAAWQCWHPLALLSPHRDTGTLGSAGRGGLINQSFELLRTKLPKQPRARGIDCHQGTTSDKRYLGLCRLKLAAILSQLRNPQLAIQCWGVGRGRGKGRAESRRRVGKLILEAVLVLRNKLILYYLQDAAIVHLNQRGH